MRRYDSTAEMYDERYKEEQEPKYRVALESVTVEGRVVLDVGCGTGLLFDHTAPRTAMLVGIDIARKPLHLARKRARRAGNLFLVQADADYLPFKPGLFEAIFAFTMLQNMPKPSESLLEIKRVARRDASILVTGLKKVFSLKAFKEMLKDAGLPPVCIVNDGFLKCYVAVSRLKRKQR